MKYLVFFLPSLISIILIYFIDLKRKKLKKLWFYLGMFIILLGIVNIASYLIIKYIYNLKTINYTLNFYLKKIGLSLGIIAFLSTLYFTIKKIVINVDKSDLTLTKPKDLLVFLKRSGIYIISLLKKYPTICFFLSTVLMFGILDFYLRSIIHQNINFYSNLAFCANMLTIIYALLITSIIYLLPKVLGKICLIISYLGSVALFLASYMLYLIKDNVLSVYDLANAQEGFTYLNFIWAKINISLIMIILISLVFLIISFRQLKKLAKINGRKKVLVLIISFGLFFTLKSLTLMSLKKYDETKWSQINYPRYYYNNFINPNRSLLVLGLYEYTARDLYLYYQNIHSIYGSVEEIEEVMATIDDSDQQNKMTGLFQDKNLIMIMMESIDNMEINEKTMPTLKYMRENGWNFTNRYSKNIATIATEFTSLTGIYNIGASYNINKNNYTMSLPALFNQNGYVARSVHENNGHYYNRNVLHKALNFSESYFLYDILENPQAYVDEQIIANDEIYKKITKDKFMTFIITISAHGPYTNNGVCAKENINNEKACLDMLSKRTDDMLATLLKRLKEDKLLDDTIIVLYSDHYPYAYNFTDAEKAKLVQLDDNYSIRALPFIIYNPNLKAQEYDMFVNDVDLAPTILNLFGIDYNPRYYIGTDIFRQSHKDLFFFSDASWSDKKIYSLSSNLNNDEYLANTSAYVNEQIELNKMLISTDYYRHLID